MDAIESYIYKGGGLTLISEKKLDADSFDAAVQEIRASYPELDEKLPDNPDRMDQRQFEKWRSRGGR